MQIEAWSCTMSSKHRRLAVVPDFSDDEGHGDIGTLKVSNAHHAASSSGNNTMAVDEMGLGCWEYACIECSEEKSRGGHCKCEWTCTCTVCDAKRLEIQQRRNGKYVL